MNLFVSLKEIKTLKTRYFSLSIKKQHIAHLKLTLHSIN